MTQEQKTDWKMILALIAFGVFYVFVQYKCTEVINTIPRFQEKVMKLEKLLSMQDNLHDAIETAKYFDYHAIRTCNECEHNGGCEIQDWNNTRSDVEPTDIFGCIFWERKK